MASITRPTNLSAEARRAPQRVDFYMLAAALMLVTIGLMALFSQSAAQNESWFRKQVVNVVIGIVPFAFFAWIHPRSLQRNVNVFYVINLIALGAVFLHGKTTKGAERWIPLGPIQFQPSELAKILTIVTLATFYTMRQDSIQKLSTFLLGLLHLLVPLVMILMQPHLGAALVMLVMWVAMSIVAGVPVRYLVTTGVVAIVLFGAALGTSHSVKVLHSYQIERFFGLFSSQKDNRGKNYQTDRAEIAFGVGGVAGTGYMRGEQKRAGYIPEQQNDFIFTVVGEEGGLIGCTLVLAAFGFFFYRIWLTMLYATDPFLKMVAGGIFAVLAFHTVVNIAMVLQLAPVVGLWLPFLSYGGTAMWLCLSCVGLLLNIHRREKPLLF